MIFLSGGCTALSEHLGEQRWIIHEFLWGTSFSQQVSFHVLSLHLGKCGSHLTGILHSQGLMNSDL